MSLPDSSVSHVRSARRPLRRAVPAAALLMAFFPLGEGWAMNQLLNHSFEDAEGAAWTAVQDPSGTLAATVFGVSDVQGADGGKAFLGEWTATANDQTVSATVWQTFTPTENVRASLKALYFREKTGTVSSAAFTVILKNPDNNPLATLNMTEDSGAWTDTGWSAPCELVANTTYTVVVKWAFTLMKNARLAAKVDDIRLSISPAGLTATASPHSTETHVQLDWSQSTGTLPGLDSAQPYAVYRGTEPGSPTRIAYSDTDSYVDTGAAGNTTYYYAVSDIDTSAQESPKSAEVSVLTRPAAPGTPSQDPPTAQKIVVRWSRPTGGDGPLTYKLERALVQGGTAGEFTERLNGYSNLQHPDTGLTCGSTYRYRVRATNTSGDGAWSGEANLQTAPCSTTVGDGDDFGTGGDACPGSTTPVVVDRFTLETNAGDDAVTSITVTLTDRAPVGLVEIVRNGSPVGSAIPGTTTSVPVAVTDVTATPTRTTYEIRLTPRSRLDMPAGNFNVSAHVTDIVHAYAQMVPADFVGDMMNVDNSAPVAGVWGANTIGDARIDLAWTKSEPPATSIVLRSTNLAALEQFALVDGENPAPGSSSDVTLVYSGPDPTKRDTGLVNGTTYYYKLFVTDSCRNHSPGALSGPLTPRGTNTVSEADNPTSRYACPGDTSPVAVDRFNLAASTGTDRINSVTVTLSPSGSHQAIGLVEVVSDDGLTVYGSQAPSGDEVVVSVGAPSHTDLIARAGTPVPYQIRLTPRAAADMPAPPGQVHAVRARVTALDCFNEAVVNDTGSATLTIDNESPAAASWTTVTPDDAKVLLNWQGSTGAVGYIVVRSESAFGSERPTEGVVYGLTDSLPNLPDAPIVYADSGTSHDDATAANNTTYYYALWAYDACSNYSPVATSGPHTPTRTILTIGDAPVPEPNNGEVLCPEATPPTFDLNAFTLQRSRGSEAISELVIELSEGSVAGVQKLEVFCGDNTRHGFASPTVSEFSLTLDPSIPVTHQSPIECQIRVAPKSLAEMPPPPGALYEFEARVTSVTTASQVEAEDTTSGVLRLDNESPPPPLWDTVIPGNATLDLTWTMSEGATRVLVLRSTLESAADTPLEGEVYGDNTTLGDSEVAFFGSGTSALNRGLLNGEEYWYAIFGLDDCRNYSVAARTGPHSPGEAATLIGDAIDPPDSAACPGDAALMLDTFTVATTLGVDAVKAVTVELSEEAGSVLSLVEIVSADGATVYGASSGAIGQVVTVPLATPVEVGTQPKTLAIRVTPKSHAQMPAAPGATVSVSGRVRSIDCRNQKTGRDTGSATLTIDNSSPAVPQWKPAVESGADLQLAWTNPEDSDLAGVLLVRGSAEPVDVPDEGADYTAGDTVGAGKALLFGDQTAYTDSAQGLENAVYRLFAQDTCGNYSAPAELDPGKPSTDGGVDVPGPALGAYDLGGCGCGTGGGPLLATGLLAALGLIGLPRRRKR